MGKINIIDVKLVYENIKKFAFKLYNLGDIEFALNTIEISAKWAYQLNFIYSDVEIDNLLKSLAEKIIKNTDLHFIPIEGRCVLIDTNGSDNHGLSQQYIRALISSNIEFAYIYEDLDLTRINTILKELKNYSKATFFSFDKKYTYVEKIKLIHTFIMEYKPEHYYMHIMPWDVVAISICSLLKQSKKYNINATDHTFWLGSSLINYSIEFREYGCSVSMNRRGLNKNQLILLPYYPISNNANFLGFPEKGNSKKVKIFSGGALYKILGENDIFFDMIKTILTQNKEAILYFASGDNKNILKKFIKFNNFENQLILLDSRSDIYQVFKNSDIYLGTYPISGGLMTQLAAVNEKPILAFSDPKFKINNIEELIFHHKLNFNVTKSFINEFHDYANKLCINSEFRIAEGKKFNNCVITSDEFNFEFNYIYKNTNSVRTFITYDIDYDAINNLYLEVENNYYPSAQLILFKFFKFKTLFISRKIIFNLVIFFYRKVIEKSYLIIKNKL